MNIHIEISENDLKKLIKDYIEDKLNIEIEDNKIFILVKSKQNFKSEWEVADFKAEYKGIK